MSDSPLPSGRTLQNIVDGFSVPLFLFSLVFTVLLLISWVGFLPRLSTVEIGGGERGVSELKAYKAELTTQIHDLEALRKEFLFPAGDSAYVDLKNEKLASPRIEDLHAAVNRSTESLVPGKDDVVRIEEFQISMDDRVLSIRGDVHGVGPRSMTVLAQFIERLKDIPDVSDVEASRFQRQERPGEGFFSPFSLELTLDD